MEKRKPHYNLDLVKKLLNKKATRLVRDIALQNAMSVGYEDLSAILSVINNLCSHHFYKSMTSEMNHKLWQDVYKYVDEEKKLYIKVQLTINSDKAVLIQFKRDTGGDN